MSRGLQGSRLLVDRDDIQVCWYEVVEWDRAHETVELVIAPALTVRNGEADADLVVRIEPKVSLFAVVHTELLVFAELDSYNDELVVEAEDGNPVLTRFKRIRCPLLLEIAPGMMLLGGADLKGSISGRLMEVRVG
jgi:hypothetical protein